MYVRRGAKAVEMALKPFVDYARAAVLLHERGYLNTKRNHGSQNTDISTPLNNTRHTLSLPASASMSGTPPNDQRKPLIFIGTEDPSVLAEAIKWGKKNDWQVSRFLSFTCPFLPFCCSPSLATSPALSLSHSLSTTPAVPLSLLLLLSLFLYFSCFFSLSSSQLCRPDCIHQPCGPWVTWCTLRYPVRTERRGAPPTRWGSVQSLDCRTHINLSDLINLLINEIHTLICITDSLCVFSL
jgi:hypothetical protein